MQRHGLAHLIRAAAAIANEYTNEHEIVVIGSQAILGAMHEAPADLLPSMEADLYPLHRPDLADLIDGAIGELSPFEERFGYFGCCAQGVGPETATLPVGWESRLVNIQNQKHRPENGLLLRAARPGGLPIGGGAGERWAVCGGFAEPRHRGSHHASGPNRAAAPATGAARTTATLGCIALMCGQRAQGQPQALTPQSSSPR